jgi:hypothetical protein
MTEVYGCVMMHLELKYRNAKAVLPSLIAAGGIKFEPKLYLMVLKQTPAKSGNA